MFNGLGVNLIAAVLYDLIILIAGMLVILTVRYVVLRRKRQFFGIRSGRRGSVRLMLSNIQVVAGGTRGVTQVQSGFQGAAITLGEYEAALRLAREIEQVPFLGPLRNWGVVKSDDIPNRGLCEIEVSPKAETTRRDFLPTGAQKDLDDEATYEADKAQMRSVLFRQNTDTLVLVGSSVYNSLSDYVLARLEPTKTFFRFFRDTASGHGQRGIVFLAEKPGPKPYYRRKGADGRCDEYFLIQRTTLHGPHGNEKRTVFVCAGTGTRATVWAAHRLLDKWRQFAAEYGDGDFAALFKVETSDPEHISTSSMDDDIPGEGPERRYPPPSRAR